MQKDANKIAVHDTDKIRKDSRLRISAWNYL